MKGLYSVGQRGKDLTGKNGEQGRCGKMGSGSTEDKEKVKSKSCQENGMATKQT